VIAVHANGRCIDEGKHKESGEGQASRDKRQDNEEAGRAMNSPTLQGDGRGEKIAGKIQNRIGKSREDPRNATYMI
jgi:hypothetical protein